VIQGQGFLSRTLQSFIGIVLFIAVSVSAAGPDVGGVTTIELADDNLPPSLFEMITGADAPPTLSYRLPDNYDLERNYPLVVYVPGYHGGPTGNIGNALKIAGPTDWVVASLPLFKRSVDRDEIGSGMLVGLSDYSTISESYRILLARLFEAVPNIDPERSAMVGFSNGALTIAVLVSNHDEFVLTRFRNFCLVDHGMFHLTDLYKSYSRDARYLILSGDDRRDPGRDLKIRGGQLLQDAWRFLGVDLSFRVMTDTGHEFGDREMALVGRWLRGEDSLDSPPAALKRIEN
jgi:predicted esterase